MKKRRTTLIPPGFKIFEIVEIAEIERDGWISFCIRRSGKPRAGDIRKVRPDRRDRLQHSLIYTRPKYFRDCLLQSPIDESAPLCTGVPRGPDKRHIIEELHLSIRRSAGVLGDQ